MGTGLVRSTFIPIFCPGMPCPSYSFTFCFGCRDAECDQRYREVIKKFLVSSCFALQQIFWYENTIISLHGSEARYWRTKQKIILKNIMLDLQLLIHLIITMIFIFMKYMLTEKNSFLKDRLCHVLVFMQEPNTKGIEPAFLFEVWFIVPSACWWIWVT